MDRKVCYMKYDFSTPLERAGHDCLAADMIPFAGVAPEEGFKAIPMWIADMSFRTAPFIREAMARRLAEPHFGYFSLSDAFYDSILYWQQENNGADGLRREHIGYENGVLGGISAALRAFSSPGDAILLHSPTYIGFTSLLKSLGRRAVLSPLKRDEKGVWRMDYEDMARKLQEEKIHLAIFCTPHNPTGRVWERWEIEKAMQVYAESDCLVISDEIWSDIILPGTKFVPTQSVSEDARQRTIAFHAPSKTFSLAGLVGAYHMVYNPLLRDRLMRESQLTHYNDCNVLSMHALIAAFSPEGREWRDEMVGVIDRNMDLACRFFRERVQGVSLARPQGTYMLYPDCGGYCRENGLDITELQHRGVRKGVIWQDGEAFLMKDTIRMNLALPTGQLEEALDRLGRFVFTA